MQKEGKFKATAGIWYAISSIAFNVIVFLSEYDCVNVRREDHDTHIPSCQNTCLFSSHDWSIQGPIATLNVWCARYSYFHWPFGFEHLSLAKNINTPHSCSNPFVLRKPIWSLSRTIAPELQECWSSRSILLNRSSERDTCSSEEAKAIKSTTFWC